MISGLWRSRSSSMASVSAAHGNYHDHDHSQERPHDRSPPGTPTAFPIRPPATAQGLDAPLAASAALFEPDSIPSTNHRSLVKARE
jgi:hypothetical protein